MSTGETVCARCHLPVKGRIVSALGKNWHPEHFTCQSCGQPITGDKFNQKDGMPYCEDDYANLFLKRCAACNKPIKEKVVVALEREWHEDHFVCSSCGKKLAGANFFEKDGAPYCQSDYNNLFAPKCNYCKRPITDAAIMALGEKYHQECFKCSKCGQPITETMFEIVGDKPICALCSA